MASKEKIAYISDIEEATEPPSGVSGNVVIFGSDGLKDSGKALSDFPDKTQTLQAISEAVQEHANNTNIHVTAEEKTAWNAKQNAISDLSQIRQNANAGAGAATALQRHEQNTNVHVTPEEKDTWNAKQDQINDLSSIRNNAEKGAEAAERDEIIIQNGEVSAVETSATVSAETAISSTEGEENDLGSKGFKMNPRAYVGPAFAGKRIHEVLFKSIGIYIAAPNDVSARLAIFQDGGSDPVAISGETALTDIATLRTFLFSEDVWLEADADYEFKVVGSSSTSYISTTMRMYFVTDFVVEGFKEYSGGSYSTLEGCFKGTSVVQCKTSAIIDLAKKSDIPTKTSELENDSGFLTSGSEAIKNKADASSLDKEYDSADGYAVGDTCVHDGVLYKCIVAVDEGDDWDATHWEATTLKSELKQKQADWNETDTNSPAFIKNKPTIPSSVTIDATLTQPGQAADAKAVGDALLGVNSHYAFATPEPSVSGTVLIYQLVDRAINYIKATVAYGQSIALESPASYEIAGTPMARDFVVVLSVTTESELVENVTVATPGNSVDYAGGNAATVDVDVGTLTAFRFTEVDRSSDRYLVSGAADPAYIAVKEIERALDAVLADGGLSELTTPFKPGMYFYNEDTGKYHKIELHGGTEADDEVNIGVEQEGVQK